MICEIAAQESHGIRTDCRFPESGVASRVARMRDDWTGIGTGDGAFPLTRLTLLRRVRQEDPDARKEALGAFWQAYWKPLYAYARHLKLSNEVAKDLVQGFCARAIEADILARFDPSKGKLRTWMLTWFHSYFVDRMREQRAEKRGGERKALPVEAALEVPSSESAQGEFDRAWAQGLIERAFDRWKQDLVQRAEDHWKLALVRLVQAEGFGKLPSTAELAARFRVSEPRVRHFIQRDSKKRLREEVLLEIREATTGETEAREELDYLLRCVAQL